MQIKVPYGQEKQSCNVPESVQCMYGKLRQVVPELDPSAQIHLAIKNLIGDIQRDKLVKAQKIAIAVSDLTRPVPSRLILEEVVSWLNQLGINEDQIIVIVGGGLHRPATPEDIKSMLGVNLISRIKTIVAHDAENIAMLEYLGTSTQGTPVYVNKNFAQADYRIVTGMIDAHQFMGFTAGVKGAVIGLGGRPTITGNHALLFSPGAELGRLEDNPARQDLEDIGRIVGVDMIVNVALNDKKQVVKAVAGHPVEAHRLGVDYAKGVFGVPMNPADIVIASPGGFPKDINIYQAQKALTPASQIVKGGGTIILVAQCIEGSGEESFEQEMSLYENPHEVFESFASKEFVIGPHKAYLWSRTLLKARTIIVSDQIPPTLAKTLMVEVASSLQEALDRVLPDYSSPTVAVLPYASSMIPIINR
ncbi:nickel-dependent lactate racemase [Desulfosporosinus shakirovi]|uniref:nickel-dependent lactate racemase n=1 Tax=Desulfosporosinus shakirovi TaxID=2885154 RepID=UPI001E305362|nr:nickel-dependent lactate racemase [Desulfosporosinus sp. SRJS8]MCB8814214.1 nickel-dependent lactate racemase [Desulfosporosinus sp. SRJS8]